MKAAFIIISGIILIITIAFLGIIGRERYYSAKYDDIPLGTTMADLKEDWGKPDEDFIHNSRHLLRYKKSIMGSYLFELKGNGNIVTAKYFDD